MNTYLENTLLLFGFTFIFYIVLMELKTFLQRVTWPRWVEQAVFWTLGIPFVISDWILNWTISPFFMDPPATAFELVTDRVRRYKKLYLPIPACRLNRIEHWRRWFAVWLCDHLNRYDQEGHC